jgi:endoglucanase
MLWCSLIPAAAVSGRLDPLSELDAAGHTVCCRLAALDAQEGEYRRLNTANFFTTDEEIGYGEAISGLTNGAHYVIDTGRNGAGPADGEMYWCNPDGRALGVLPTIETGNGHVDAYLWVKRPGESDGSCGRGEPGAGRFIDSFAIELARNAGR